MMRNPTISIIIPVYNSEHMIGECIESLLNQDYPKDKVQIIIVDNNSTDNTAKVIQSYPVEYVMQNKIQSSYASRNEGAKYATGEALFFFDADQTIEKDFLNKMTSRWNQKEISAFNGSIKAVGESQTVAGIYWHQQEDVSLEEKQQKEFPKLGAGHMLIRSEVFKKLEGFNSKLVSFGDFEFAYRLNNAGYDVGYIDDAIIYHKERSTVKSMLKREYRIGFGRSQFDATHKDRRESMVSVFVGVIKRTFVGILALIWGIFKPLKDLKRSDHLGLIMLDIAMRWSYMCGRWHFSLKLNKGTIPAKW